MENFEYYNPVKVVFGEGTLEQTGAYASLYGQKALLVTYRENAFFTEPLARLRASLEAHGVACAEYPGVTANPLLCQAEEGVRLCRDTGAQVVIALGGGSVMDCAKIIAAGVLYPHALEKMVRFSHSRAEQLPPKESLPTILIPTLPATGSEMNPTAVITDEKTGRKSYVWESCLYARAAIMDPLLTLSLPPYQTACGAFDIVSHVVEAYLNGRPDRNLTLQENMQEGVIRAVLQTLPRVMENPGDVQARGVLMWAASIALNGWLTAGTFGFTPMHQMGHVLSARYNATHGATLACMMPAWFRYFADRPDNAKYAQLAGRCFGGDIPAAADRLEALMASYGVQTRLSQLGVKRDELAALTDSVEEISFGPDHLLDGHPKTSREDIRAIYELAF